MNETNTTLQKQKSNKRLAICLMLFVLAMFGFGYLLVPLYDVLCKALDINGKTGGPAAAALTVDKSRTITVQFLATNNAHLPWKFYPVQKSIKLHPGENRKIEYFAQNMSNQTMTVQAIPSVTPSAAAQYLKKTECFCFNQQTLKSHESMKMPLLFHLDSDLPENIRVVTLSYTLFDVTHMKQAKPSNKIPGRLN